MWQWAMPVICYCIVFICVGATLVAIIRHKIATKVAPTRKAAPTICKSPFAAELTQAAIEQLPQTAIP